MKITISGRPGAGKTTVAKKLAERINHKFISVGDLQGEIAKDRKITINELMELAKTDKSIHLDMDKKIEEIGKTQNNFVIEGWIAFHFIPDSYKIFLDVDNKEGAKRIFHDSREDEPKEKNIEKTEERVGQRVQNTRNAFLKYYGIDFLDRSHYDLLIDTTSKNPKEIVDIIKEKIK